MFITISGGKNTKNYNHFSSAIHGALDRENVKLQSR